MATGWNPSDCATQLTLSGGNLIVTSGAGSWNTVRCAQGRSSGKYYVEYVIGTVTTATQVGVALGGGTINGNACGSLGVCGFGVDNRGGFDTFTLFTNNSLNGSLAFTTGDVIGLAMDFGTQNVWLAKNNNYVSFGGTGSNPSTLTNPPLTSQAGAATYFPAGSPFSGGGSITIQADSANQTYAPPTGFSAWGVSATPVAFRRSLSALGTRAGSRQIHAAEGASSSTAASRLFAWGRNDHGQCGVGTSGLPGISSPTQVGTIAAPWQLGAGGNHALMIINGALWTWGWNHYYCLGLGAGGGHGYGNYHTDGKPFSSPVQVGTEANWKQAAGSFYCSFAIKNNGTLWTWGNPDHGQLGFVSATYVSSPVQVGALTTWNKIYAFLNGGMAIKQDGTLWAWGANAFGVLGVGDTVNRSSPTQVGVNTWKQIAGGIYHCLGIDTAGKLWAWGQNNLGQLGLGNTTNYSTPQQVGVATNWVQVGCCVGSFSGGAINTSGQLFTWGPNNFGQLGLGDTSNRLVPTQVGALTNWAKVQFIDAAGFGLRTDGTLWAWGHNQGTLSGYLGLGNTTNYSSPVQIGSLTTWTDIRSEYYTMFALRRP